MRTRHNLDQPASTYALLRRLALFDPRTWRLRVSSQDGDVDVAFGQPHAVAASRAVAASALAPKTSDVLPEGQDIAVAGATLVGHGKFADGTYTYLHANAPIGSPCGDGKVQDAFLWSASVGDPKILRAYAGRHVTLHGSINCPSSGIQLSPDSAQNP
jgi:hypothetical protein